MKSFAGASLAVLALATAGAANSQPPRTEILGAPRTTQMTRTDQVPRMSISIPRGKSAPMDFPFEMRIAGATDARIADVRMVTPRHATILGVGYGQTDAQFYDANGRLALILDVKVEQDIRAMEESLARVIPAAKVQAQAVGDSVLLTGTVANAAEADRAIQVASIYAGDAKQVRNLLTITGKDQVIVKAQFIEVNRTVIKQLGFDTNFLLGQLGMPQYVLGNTPSYGVNGGFQGGVNAGYQIDTTSQPVANATQEVARALFGDSGVNAGNLAQTVDRYLRGGSVTGAQTAWIERYLSNFIGEISIIDRVANPLTGELEELEVSMSSTGITPSNLRQKAQQYLAGGNGLTLAEQTWFDGFFSQLPERHINFVQNVDSTFIDPHNKANPVATDRIGSRGLNQGRALIQAFERQGLVRTLAEPNLTAVSGEAAKFLAGGEYPVPSGRDNQGNITVEFKPFGVGLGFTPVVLSDGRISLKISTEVSELSTQGALTITGVAGAGSSTVIPALTVRRVDNTIELPSGGSMMIAGLLQEQTRQNIDKVPGVSDMPVLGALARSRDFLNNETELVVIVTAYLVSSTSRGNLQTPADGLRIATDAETMLLGKLNTAYKAPPEATEGRTYQGPFGHVID